MSFVMIAAGANSRSAVRTLPVRPLLFASAGLALALLSGGAALGYWAARSTSMTATSATTTPPLTTAPHAAPAVPQHPPAPAPFAVEQLGAIAGRVFKLESDAAQLSKRIGILQKDEAPVRQKPAGSGGPMLPARTGFDDLIGMLEGQLGQIEQQIARAADAAAQRNETLMRLPTRAPIPGAEMGSRYGNREDPFTHHQAFHAGLDFAAQAGKPILAAAGGTVASASFRAEFGWMVEIAHGNGLTTRYAHASKLLVKAGDVVAPGEAVALVGSTGRSTGPHLHFELLRHGEHVDPRQYLDRL